MRCAGAELVAAVVAPAKWIAYSPQYEQPESFYNSWHHASGEEAHLAAAATASVQTIKSSSRCSRFSCTNLLDKLCSSREMHKDIPGARARRGWRGSSRGTLRPPSRLNAYVPPPLRSRPTSTRWIGTATAPPTTPSRSGPSTSAPFVPSTPPHGIAPRPPRTHCCFRAAAYRAASSAALRPQDQRGKGAFPRSRRPMSCARCVCLAEAYSVSASPRKLSGVSHWVVRVRKLK